MSEFDFAAEYAAFGDDLKGVSYEGDHTLVVQKATAGTTAKGKQMFTLTLGFTSGPYAAKGKTFQAQLYWSPENDTAARIFAQNMRILGASQEWIMSTRPTPAQIAEQITGTVFEARLKPEDFNGQPTTRVTYRSTVSSKPTSGPAAASPAAAQAVSLDDDDEPGVGTATGEVKQPATVGTSASDDPWA